jgi:two-component system, cell cycle response regulator DivK
MSRPLHPLILVVDDFDDALDMYAEWLTFKGYAVVTARNGEEAIGKARAERPAVIFMDIRMHGMTGTVAMRLLKDDPQFAEIPIIALTAHALAAEREAAMAAGFDAVLSKPVLLDELVAANRTDDRRSSKRYGLTAFQPFTS